MRIARIVDSDDQVTWAAQQDDGGLLRIEGEPLTGNVSLTRQAVVVKRWLPPVEPVAIFCIGLNYRKHAEEAGLPVPEYPVVFIKNPSAATGHEQPIRIPKVCTDEVDYECELAVVIRRTCRNVSKSDALDYVLGYTCANDVSARSWQLERGGGQWNRGKGFDTFAPLGPILVTTDDLGDPNALSIRTHLNGELVQDSNTRDMIFDVPTLISFLSEDTTLLPGTVIFTGTPSGIGWAREPRLLLHPGDQVCIEIERIGRLENPVAGPS